MHKARPLAFVAGLLLACAPAFGAAPVGVEFQVNTFFTSNQRNAPVAVDADGDFVVVWQSVDQDGNIWGIFGQRYTSDGASAGVEFQVNVFTSGSQFPSRVEMDGDGDFVVVGISGGSFDGSSYGVFFRRFASDGSPQSGDVLVNVFTSSTQTAPVLALAPTGEFVVAWQSFNQDGSSGGVFGRRFASDGAAIGGEFQVNTTTANSQGQPGVAAHDDGDFVVLWESHSQDGDNLGVFGQRFDSSGARLAGEFQVNSYTTSLQGQASAVIDDDGSFVVVWHSHMGLAGYDVLGQRFSSAGERAGGEFLVTTLTSSSQSNPRLGRSADGGFVVVWDGLGNTGEIAARIFTPSGSPESPEFLVNSYTGGPYGPAVGMNASGRFVVTWAFFGGDADTSGVRAQRFDPSPPLDIDLDGSTGALTDGLLVLRHRFGFSGPALVAGALGAACKRCLAEDVDAHVDANLTDFDVDGDGGTGALTDGILILRYLFGFRGSGLTSGAIGEDCSRCDAAEIEPAIAALLI